MDYERNPDEDDDVLDQQDYDTDAGQIKETFHRYRETDDLEELVGMPVGNEQLNTLPLVVDPDSAAWEDLGDFLTTVYNAVGQVRDDETVFSYETETQRPVNGLGDRLDREVTLLTDSTLENVGKKSYGEIINTGTIHGDLFALGYENRGRVLNTGTVEGDMGRKQHGLVINDGNVEQRLGRDSEGVIYNAGTVEDAGPIDDGLFYTTGRIETLDVNGDTGVYILDGDTEALNGLEYADESLIIDIDDSIDTETAQIIADQGPLLDQYLDVLSDTLTAATVPERYDALETLDPMYSDPQQRPGAFIKERLEDDDFLVQWSDYLDGMEPNPAPAIRATVEAILDDRLEAIDLDAGAMIHETVRLETEETDEPIDMRSYLGWQHAQAVESDKRYVASDAVSRLLDEVG